MKSKIAGLVMLLCAGRLHGATTTVSTAAQLLSAVQNANNGDTVLMSDGAYALPGTSVGLNITKSIVLKSINGSSRVTVTAPSAYIAIQVNASGVTVDGITIQGAQWGVQVTAVSGVVLRNLNVATSGTGGHSLGLESSTHSVIELCTANNSYHNGIDVSRGANYNLIINNTIQATQQGDGIAVVTSNHNIISGNTINNTYFDGVSLNGSQYNYVALNRINSPHNGVTVTKDVPSSTQSIGNYVGNNTMVLNPSNPAGGSDGIWFDYDSDYNMAFGNDAANAVENGMAIFNSIGNYIRANVFHQNPQGGIFVFNSNGPSGTTPPAHNSIQQNYLYKHGANGGVTLDTAPNTDISFNYIAGDPAQINTPIAGLLVRSGVTNALFLSNVVRDLLQGENIDASATGISLYLNRHVNTPSHYTFAGAQVQWDSGSTALGGNYFSDFTAANGNPSNGATPYTNIFQDNQGDKGLYKDNYPYQSESLGRPYLVAAVLPAAGSQLPAGSLKTISWASQACVLVDLTLEGGATAVIASNVADYGFYRWTVPNVAPGAYSVKVDCKDSTGTPIRASSTSSQFKITPPDLVLLSPQTNQMVDSGSSLLISWAKSANVTMPVDVYIRYASGSGFTLLQSGVTLDYLSVPAPVSASNQAEVMIVSGSYSDSTDGWFTIRANSTGAFTSPAPSSSSTLLQGSAYPVEWVSPQTTAWVDIDLISGSTTRNIATQLADFSRYLMLVPALPGAGAYLRLTFHNAAGTVLNTAQSSLFNVGSGSGGPPTADSVSPSSGTGSAQTFTAVYSDSGGAGAINNRQILINSSLNGLGACLVLSNSNGIYLFNDNDSALLGPVSGSGTVSNSQCTLNGSGSGVASSGNSSMLTVSLSFKPAFAGAKTIFLYADDASGNSGWQTRGTYTVTAPQAGRINLTVYRPSGELWYVSSATGQTTVQQWGISGDIPLTGDFDGDGVLDYAVWRPSTAEWFIIPSSAPGTLLYKQWGFQNDVPVPGDYDGDGKTDIAVWRPSTGTWYVIPSTNPTAPVVRQWGVNGDKPVVADFDGDGRADFVVWRPSNGTWFIVPSSQPSNVIVKQWGLNGDEPVAGDYDGDKKADFAVFRPSNATWLIVPSASPGTTIVQQWGVANDVPVPRDYDQDGRVDIAVWRPANGSWYIRPTTAPGTFQVFQWGLTGDIPLYKPAGY